MKERFVSCNLMLRVYRLQHRNYSDTLHALQLEELMIAPFSEGEPIHKREGERETPLLKTYS